MYDKDKLDKLLEDMEADGSLPNPRSPEGCLFNRFIIGYARDYSRNGSFLTINDGETTATILLHVPPEEPDSDEGF